MAKLKLRKGTLYPFKHLEKPGDKFSVTAEKKNVTASYIMYKAKNNITCNIVEYDNGTVIVTRTNHENN